MSYFYYQYNDNYFKLYCKSRKLKFFILYKTQSCIVSSINKLQLYKNRFLNTFTIYILVSTCFMKNTPLL